MTETARFAKEQKDEISEITNTKLITEGFNSLSPDYLLSQDDHEPAENVDEIKKQIH